MTSQSITTTLSWHASKQFAEPRLVICEVRLGLSDTVNQSPLRVRGPVLDPPFLTEMIPSMNMNS